MSTLQDLLLPNIEPDGYPVELVELRNTQQIFVDRAVFSQVYELCLALGLDYNYLMIATWDTRLPVDNLLWDDSRMFDVGVDQAHTMLHSMCDAILTYYGLPDHIEDADRGVLPPYRVKDIPPEFLAMDDIPNPRYNTPKLPNNWAPLVAIHSTVNSDTIALKSRLKDACAFLGVIVDRHTTYEENSDKYIYGRVVRELVLGAAVRQDYFKAT